MKNMVIGALLLLSGAVSGLAASLDEKLAAAGDNAGEIRAFLEASQKGYGEAGKRAAEFLVTGMPERDLKSLKKDFLLENLELALKAREQFPWSKDIPEEVFLNDVLPYASLDETRESWRKDFQEKCKELVKDCKTTTEAAQAINKGLFNIIKVHYNTGRKAPNQSPSESITLGKATCTGLSIILVDACRSVGVPARVAGTALWSNKRGNHTWTEIYDGGAWFFTGADEYNAQGLNRAWFVGSASQAQADDWRHAIWATSWKTTGSHFPMVWSLEDKSVPAVNVTGRYAKAKPKEAGATVFLRLWEKEGGDRLVGEVTLVNAAGKSEKTVKTKAGTADLNDMPSFTVKTGKSYRLRVKLGDEVRWEDLVAVSPGSGTLDLVWPELGKGGVKLKGVKSWLARLPEERYLSVPEGDLSKEDAAQVTSLIWETLKKDASEDNKAALKNKVVKVGDDELKFLVKEFGEGKAGERSLWISMHGGGGTAARVNDGQWHNQIRLYQPKEGIMIAPRAPTNTWNMWHRGHIDDLFDKLIATYVSEGGVDPNKVYLMGYSAGGDGVYQLAPRLADRYAAAAMMAGHPNNANALGLRNLPFMIFMGGKDGAYSRNKVAAQWGERLAELRKEDPEGYENKVTIYPEFGHWMNGKDREALPWMAARTRNPWPSKMVWHQSGRTHDRFYWLAVPKGVAKGGQIVRAEIKGQTIEVQAEGLKQLKLRLHDELLDLDHTVKVTVNGKEAFNGKVTRNVKAIWDSLQQRRDPASAASAVVDLKW